MTVLVSVLLVAAVVLLLIAGGAVVVLRRRTTSAAVSTRPPSPAPGWDHESPTGHQPGDGEHPVPPAVAVRPEEPAPGKRRPAAGQGPTPWSGRPGEARLPGPTPVPTQTDDETGRPPGSQREAN